MGTKEQEIVAAVVKQVTKNLLEIELKEVELTTALYKRAYEPLNELNEKGTLRESYTTLHKELGLKYIESKGIAEILRRELENL